MDVFIPLSHAQQHALITKGVAQRHGSLLRGDKHLCMELTRLVSQNRRFSAFFVHGLKGDLQKITGFEDAARRVGENDSLPSG